MSPLKILLYVLLTFFLTTGWSQTQTWKENCSYVDGVMYTPCTRSVTTIYSDPISIVGVKKYYPAAFEKALLGQEIDISAYRNVSIFPPREVTVTTTLYYSEGKFKEKEEISPGSYITLVFMLSFVLLTLVSGCAQTQFRLYRPASLGIIVGIVTSALTSLLFWPNDDYNFGHAVVVCFAAEFLALIACQIFFGKQSVSNATLVVASVSALSGFCITFLPSTAELMFFCISLIALDFAVSTIKKQWKMS